MSWPRIVRPTAARRRSAWNLDRKAEPAYDALTAGLSRLVPDPAPLSNAQISRIEAKVFGDIFGEASPLRSSAPSRSHISIEGPVESAVMSDYYPLPDRFRATEVIALESSLKETLLDLNSIPVARIPAPAPRIQQVGVWRGLAAVFVTLSMTATAYAGMPSSGGPFRPFKLVTEQIHLAATTAPLKRAEIMMSIASDRLESLFSSPRFRLASLSQEMDSAGLLALAILENAPESKERTDLLVDLLGLGRSEQRHLRALLIQPPDGIKQPLASSLETADRIVASAEKLLISHIALNTDEPTAEAVHTLKSHSSSKRFRSQGARSVSPRFLRIKPNAGTDPPVPNVENPEDTQPSCELLKGQICINLPVDLP